MRRTRHRYAMRLEATAPSLGLIHAFDVWALVSQFSSTIISQGAIFWALCVCVSCSCVSRCDPLGFHRVNLTPRFPGELRLVPGCSSVGCGQMFHGDNLLVHNGFGPVVPPSHEVGHVLNHQSGDRESKSKNKTKQAQRFRPKLRPYLSSNQAGCFSSNMVDVVRKSAAEDQWFYGHLHHYRSRRHRESNFYPMGRFLTTVFNHTVCLYVFSQNIKLSHGNMLRLKSHPDLTWGSLEASTLMTITGSRFMVTWRAKAGPRKMLGKWQKMTLAQLGIHFACF